MKNMMIGFLAGWIVSSADWWVYTSRSDRAWIIFGVAMIVTSVIFTIEDAASERRMRRWRMRRAFRRMELAEKQNRP